MSLFAPKRFYHQNPSGPATAAPPVSVAETTEDETPIDMKAVKAHYALDDLTKPSTLCITYQNALGGHSGMPGIFDHHVSSLKFERNETTRTVSLTEAVLQNGRIVGPHDMIPLNNTLHNYQSQARFLSIKQDNPDADIPKLPPLNEDHPHTTLAKAVMHLFNKVPL